MDGKTALNRPWLHEYLCSFPGVTTDYKSEWGFLHYRVGGKIFAIICTPDERYKAHAGRELVTLRCDERAMGSASGSASTSMATCRMRTCVRCAPSPTTRPLGA